MHDPRPHPLARLIDPAIAALAFVNRPLARFGRAIAGALIAGMLLLAIAQIVSRAAFGHTIDWAEELARFMLVWAVLLVAPFAYRTGAKVAIGALVQSLPPRLMLLTSVVLNLIIGWICAMLLIDSIAFWQRGLVLSASALPFRMAWVYAMVPAALLALALVASELVLRLIASTLRHDAKLRLVGSVASVADD
jgi:TRAP-type C4-dicarboxylate transport system permease small subunit